MVRVKESYRTNFFTNVSSMASQSSWGWMIHLEGGFSYLSEVGGLARLILGDLVHRVLGALLTLAVSPPLLGYVDHLLQ